MLKVAKSKSAALDEFDFVVDAFDNATSCAVTKVIGYSVYPVCQCSTELRKQPRFLGNEVPLPQALNCLFFCGLTLKDMSQTLLKPMSRLDQRRHLIYVLKRRLLLMG